MTGARHSRYVIYRIIPAMALPSPISLGPLIFCTTDHFKEYDLAGDPGYEGTLRIAANHVTASGGRIGGLGVVLAQMHEADNLSRSDIPRMCRDALSLCHITAATQRDSVRAASLSVCASDYFEVLPLFFTKDKRLVVHSPSCYGFIGDINGYRQVLPVHLAAPNPLSFECDQTLLKGLDRAVGWLATGRNVLAIRQIFRALAMAFHATRLLHEPDSDLHDLGTRIIQWISAFEILVHPGSGRVSCRDVVKLINTINWPKIREIRDGPRERRRACLAHKHYAYRTGRQTVKGREGAASHFYRQLYDLRNALAHGNRTSLRQFRVFRKPTHWRVDVPCPLLFRECIIERLRNLGCIPKPTAIDMRIEDVSPNLLSKAIVERLEQYPYHEALARMLLEPRPDG